MSSLFGDTPFFENDNLVSLEDGVETMRDGDDRSPFHQLAGGFFEQGFGFRVEAGGGFIHDEDGRIFEEGARKGESLCLSAGEARSAFADDGLIFLRQAFDEVMQTCGLRGNDDFFVSCIRFAESNVGGDGVVEEVRFLRNPGD